jgi:hypothetical protein
MVLGCSSDEGTAAAAQEPARLEDGLPAACNPLRTEGECLFPFPSAVYLEPDSTSATGFRVAFPSEVFPVSRQSKVPYDTARVNRADGFSPATQLLAWFPERLDPSSLTPVDDPARSLSPTSSTLIVDMETLSLVDHFSELDATIRFDEQHQSLIIRPMKRLQPGRRYAVAVTDALRTLEGKVPTSPKLFASIASGAAPDDPMAQKQAARMPAILDALSAAGVPRQRLLLAWDFVTATDGFLTQNLLAMREQALQQAGDQGMGFSVTGVDENLNGKVLRRIRGTFTVPSFLTSVDPKTAESQLVFGPDGKPQVNGKYEAPFTVLVPASAMSKAPLPVLLVGHGFLGTGEGVLGGEEGSAVQDLIEDKGYVAIATDWTGMSKAEGVEGSNLAAVHALQDMNKIPWVTDRLQQSMINALVLTRTARAMALDAAFAVDAGAGTSPALDPQRTSLYGISLGGILGGTLLAYSTDLTHGALSVPGGQWTLLMQRSTNWELFRVPIAGAYREPLEQQIVIAIAQTQFDFTDPVNLAHTWAQPLPGTPAKKVLLQMSVGDPSVSNLATAVVARTAGLSVVGPSDVSVYGLPGVQGPAPAGLTIWNTKPEPLPPVTNALPKQNGAHSGIQRLPKLWAQLDHFFTSGEVIHTCDGACDPE